MTVHTPGRVLLQRIPLQFVRSRVAGSPRKRVDQSLPIIPLIDVLITLIVFLILTFSTGGAIGAPAPSVAMPSASNTEPLEVAPIVTIDAKTIALDGTPITTVGFELAGSNRIEGLIERLENIARHWQRFHPGVPQPGSLIVMADVEVDYRVLRKVLFSAGQAGFLDVHFAVNERARVPLDDIPPRL